MKTRCHAAAALPRPLTVALLSMALTLCSSVAVAERSGAAAEGRDAAAQGQNAVAERQGADKALGEKPTLAQARTAFMQGRELMEKDEWSQAESKFEYAARAKNTPGLRYYIGYCQEQQGLLVEARESYRNAETLLLTMPAEDVEEIIPKALFRVQDKLAVVHLDNVPDDATLLVDGRVVPLSEQLYVNPGEHTLVVKSEGYSDFTAQLSLVAGQGERVRAEMVPVVGAEESPNDVDARQDSARKWSGARKGVFWSSVAVAGVGLGTGVVGTMYFRSSQRRVNELREVADEISAGDESACSNPTEALSRVCSDLDRAVHRRNVTRGVMVGGYVAAGVGTLGALATALLWPEAHVEVEVGLSAHSSWFGLRRSF